MHSHIRNPHVRISTLGGWLAKAMTSSITAVVSQAFRDSTEKAAVMKVIKRVVIAERKARDIQVCPIMCCSLRVVLCARVCVQFGGG